MSEDTAPFVRQTFGEYVAERSIQTRADGLNAKGQRTPRSVKALNKMLKNCAYIGEHHYGDIAVGVRHTCAGQQGHVRQMDLNASTLPKGTLLFSAVLRQLESMDHAYRGSLRDVTTQDESGHLSYRTTFLRTDSNYAPLFAEPAERIRTRESVIEIRQCQFELCRQRHSCEQQSEPAL